ncbi:MAG: hypothetical protein ABSB80_06045 [Methanoregula sp.]|jgi:hypothetical protein|uniref:hypothetical protein n=1 Tax=Methanoregula sp. TaxID=2052170 RepID=UPI003D10AB75
MKDFYRAVYLLFYYVRKSKNELPMVKIPAGNGKIVKVNLMNSSSAYYLGVCSFLLAIIFVAGCIGTQKTTPETNFSTGAITSTLTQIRNNCTIPTLVFNNSQEITKLGNYVGIIGLKITGPGDKSSSEPGTVPLGGVIYHDAGFTRIFDSTGNQILLINDSESFTLTPGGGSQPSTSVYSVPELSRIVKEGDNVTNIYQNSACIATIITAPSSRVKVISE